MNQTTSVLHLNFPIAESANFFLFAAFVYAQLPKAIYDR